MLRTVLAVLLASALLAVSLPVVESARVEHAEQRIDASLQRLDAAATDLAADNDPTPPGRAGAHRQHTLVLPSESWGSAGTGSLTFPPPTAERFVRYQVAGGQETPAQFSVPVVGPPGGLTLRSGGRQRLVLSLEQRGRRPVVVVSRADV